VNLSYPLDQDLTTEEKAGVAHRRDVVGEAFAVLEFVGGVVPVVVELREDDDGVRFEVAKTAVKFRPRNRPAAGWSYDWRLGPWSGRAKHGGVRRAGVELGSKFHTR
jgi:hypothetical protein